MNIKKVIVILTAAVMLCACSERNVPEVTLRVMECATMPSPRASAAACALDGKGYIFGGRGQNGKYLNDLWQYDPTTDSWNAMSPFPGKARVNATMTAYQGALYVGLGFSGEKVYVDSCYLRDLWRYTPSDNTWTKLSDSPYRNTVRGVAMTSGERIYVLYSAGWSYTRDVIYYDITADRWDSIPYNEHRAESCFGGSGASCGGRYFFGTGLNRYNLRQWYETELRGDSWTKRTSIPGKGRELCACCATDKYVYLFGGRYFGGDLTGGEVFAEYLRYSVADDAWERCGDMPCGRAENMIAFRIDGNAYFGLGENAQGTIINTLYRIEE